jgi:nucleolar complex protein 2
MQKIRKYSSFEISLSLSLLTISYYCRKSICTRRKWKSIQTLVKSFLNSVLFILKQLTENDTLYFIIKEAEKLVHYYSCFPKLAGQYLKVLLQHWGTAEDKVRVVAFINIRKLALVAPHPFVDLCLKVKNDLKK